MKKIRIKKLKNSIYIGLDFKIDFDNLIKLNNLKNTKIILFVGKRSFRHSIFFKTFNDLVRKHNIKILEIVTVFPNPVIGDIKTTLKKLDGHSIDAFLAIGGGSVIDYSKACKLYSDFSVPIITVYTNIGSGSIVSPFVVYDNHEFKIGDFSEKIIPDFVYINTKILKTLPQKVLKAGIRDIFGHAIESSLSKTATPNSRSDADKAIYHLKQYFISKDLKHLILADTYAGLSESVGIVLLPHALGHLITYKYGVSHGYASFIFLRNYIDFLIQNKVEIKKEFLSLLDTLHKSRTELNIDETKIKNITLSELSMVKKYMRFAFDNSPITMKDDEIERIFNNSIKDYEKN